MKGRIILISMSFSALLPFQVAAQSKQTKPREAVIVSPEAGAKVAGARGEGSWKLTKDQTGGSIAISEVVATNVTANWLPGHVHTREDEIWYVMEGELSFEIGGRTAKAGPGTIVFAPRGVPHRYIVTKAPARYLLIFTPAGIDPLFSEADKLRTKYGSGTPQFRDQLEEARAKYGVYAAEKWEGVTNAKDPTDGTWELDVQGSKLSPGAAWKSQTVVYRADGKNITMIAVGITSRGQRVRRKYIGAYDGQDYPVMGKTRGETIAQLRTDYYTVRTTTKIGGRVTTTGMRVISKDGKFMTVTTSNEGPTGSHDALVFRKR